MQGVSVAFKAAAVAAVRQPKIRLNCWFFEAMTAESNAVVNTELDATNFPAAQLINGVMAPDKKWALARDDCFPADDLYPIAPGHEGGWFSTVASDAGGVLSDYVQVTLTTSSLADVPIQTFGWRADTWLGYPVDFVIKYKGHWVAGDPWITLKTVVGHASPTYEYTHTVPLDCRIVQIDVTKISRASTHLYLCEIITGYHVDLTDYMKTCEVTRERNMSEQGAPPLGNYAASQLTLTLDNSDRRFSARNAAGPYYGMILPNRRLVLEFGFVLADTSIEYCDAGTFYTRKWTSDNAGNTSVVALDGCLRLSGTWYEALVQEGRLASDLITDLAVAAGVNAMVIQPTTAVIPYAVLAGASALQYMKDLAAAEGGCIYFDESGALVFQALGGFASADPAVITLTDADLITKAGEVVDESIVYNVAKIRGKHYKEGAHGEIWALQETFSLWHETRFIGVKFSGPAVNVDAPVLVDADPDISIVAATYYSQGGLLQIENVAWVTEEIRAMTIDGTPLEEDGVVVAESENQDAVTAYGERAVEVTNDFIQSYEQALLLAEAITDGKADPGRYLPDMELQCGGLPHLQLGDKIHLHNTHLGLNEDVYVLGMTLNWDGGLHGSLRLLSVTPVGPTDAPTPGQMAE